MRNKASDKLPDRDEGVQEEVGATAGRTHREVLEQTLGPERAHEALTSQGPSEMPERRNHAQPKK